ncbi:MAG: transposase [Acetobacteraceae bacterium]
MRRQAPAATGPIHALGIDEWAWRRRQRYGTILCDLKRRRIIDLLPDRDRATVQLWLRAHPEIGVVARDHSGGFVAAVSEAAPNRSGRRPLAPDGERQRCLPGSRSGRAGPDPPSPLPLCH